ncbi:polysaccharide biosynthesis tyrosine autokinase [Prevotella melaninogenica]|uniref:GumC family protein n=1 Tax=Prevotella melaninogenica TaxID=28132 RepID=UPI001BAA11D4|nr:tyrosine-protein kinase [Prevotella melaninogenica]MBW4729757.1 polysaccharide biosynthesis tyrosine autokinase [Prevotella melaninogenica]MBW4732512.1 polysaccharide biosynthesis tyrosine autokinase [Prevotella melaninogenica]MBW4750531.1 polysaccharide biosynthesis tyrosine autokinase [Prevotella melaninogenica]QUB69282.1 polysaccharide biosynthesis tyrosine autokinase [Prevotella melaninogenica]
MEETTKLEQGKELEINESNSSFDFATLYRTIVLNWYWFLLSLIIFGSLGAIYLRYVTPMYQSTAKLLIKDESNSNRRGSSLQNMSNLGIISNSTGIDNEMEILTSHSIAEDAIRDLKLYVNYTTKGRVKDIILYRNQPLNVDVDQAHLERLNAPINLSITRDSLTYTVTGTYYVPTNDNSNEGPYSINRKFTSLPATIVTRAGIITISPNYGHSLKNADVLNVSILSPRMASNKYVNELQVAQTAKSTSIAQLQLIDEVPQRSLDYLKQLAIVYNRQANEDKNTIALRTDKFINDRLGKINAELGKTEGQLQNYKQQNGIVELKMNAGNSVANQNSSELKLAEVETQIELFNTIAREVESSSRNLSQVIPSNVGLDDQSSTSLINKYNELVLERNRLLRSASESSPVVEPLTAQIRELNGNIRRAIGAARQNLQIQRDAVLAQVNKFNEQVAETPQQERMLTQIDRQQEVKSGLYLMLLQKREENNISLAATADKGKLIDDPQLLGKISPKSTSIMLVALLIGLALPVLVILILQFFRYKIEGHDDVARLTKLPIIADVAIASNKAKGKADIVVHENQNNQMEEIFRSMRTNLQFMLKEGQKVVLFTSSTSGEGKTFNAANLSVSFGLLGKKVILIGLDIRRPRLAELFGINDHKHGITNLLVKDNPTIEDIQEQILPSGVNKNLDLLMAGPIPPNPAELIARNSLDIIINLLKEKYDYIMIDTAPVGLVTDTLQIARVADASIYMCRADYTPKSSFNLINALANEKKFPNMAIVLNGIDMSKRKYSYYYGYGGYGKYGRYGRASYGTSYGQYGNYGNYGNYANSHYGNKHDDSIKR